jgi:hypothetical protein
MKFRTACAMVLLVLEVGSVLAIEIASPFEELKKLPAVYVDEGACPFEYCTYREWEVTDDADLYEVPHSTRIVYRLKKGERVIGKTGRVEMKPIPVNVLSDHTDRIGNKFKKGETFFMLTPLGEFNYRAWADGKLFTVIAKGIRDRYEPNRFVYEPSGPFWAEVKGNYKDNMEWWKQIESSSGVVGWTSADVFFGQDGSENLNDN